MLFYFHLLIFLLRSEENQIISQGVIDTICTDEEVAQTNNYFEELKKECLKDPSLEDCDEVIKHDVKMSNGKDINSYLSSFSETTNELYLNIFSYKGELDFNSLRNQKRVSVLAYPSEEEDHDEICAYSGDDDYKLLSDTKKREIKKKLINMLKKHREINFNSKMLEHTNTKKIEESKIQIVGNIKEKVSFLTLFYGDYEIVKSDLNCDNTYLAMSHLHKSNYKVKSNFFLQEYYKEGEIDGESQKMTSELINVGEYSLVLLYGYRRKHIRISFHETNFSLSSLPEENDDDYEENEGGERNETYVESGLSFPYDMMKNFGLVTFAESIDFHKPKDTILNEVKNANITILKDIHLPGFEEDDESGDEGDGGDNEGDEGEGDGDGESVGAKYLVKSLSKEEVKFTDSGWENSDVKPKIFITCDEGDYDVDTSSLSLENEKFALGEIRNQGGDSPSKKKKKNKTGMIVGIVVACVVVIAIIAVLIWYFAFYKKKKLSEQMPSDKEDYSVGF